MIRRRLFQTAGSCARIERRRGATLSARARGSVLGEEDMRIAKCTVSYKACRSSSQARDEDFSVVGLTKSVQ